MVDIHALQVYPFFRAFANAAQAHPPVAPKKAIVGLVAAADASAIVVSVAMSSSRFGMLPRMYQSDCCCRG